MKRQKFKYFWVSLWFNLYNFGSRLAFTFQDGRESDWLKKLRREAGAGRDPMLGLKDFCEWGHIGLSKFERCDCDIIFSNENSTKLSFSFHELLPLLVLFFLELPYYSSFSNIWVSFKKKLNFCVSNKKKLNLSKGSQRRPLSSAKIGVRDC